MKLLRSLIAASLLFSGFASSVAMAQPNATVYDAPIQFRTYSAAKVGLTPAASATDFFTIRGAAGARIRVRKLHCDGISTAAATAFIQVVKRSAVNTTGTSAAATAVPYNSSPGTAASATVLSYTVNPGALGTAVGVVAVGQLTTNTAATSAINNTGVTFDFTNQWVFLLSASETLALNANAASFTSGASLNCSVEWSEG